MKTLTGRTKYRPHKRWFREPLLVLQVEVRHWGEEPQNIGNCVEMVPYDFTLWVDAMFDDLRRLRNDHQHQS